MFAEIESAISIRSPLLYNERKVEAKQAIFLDAHNFWQEKDDLSLREKRERFNNLTVLNERSEKKIAHFSINFHPDDKLDDKQMTRIAAEFMKAIDFGDQPWLLYRHIDAGHPHMHIVSTNIRRDGSRILNDDRAPHNLIRICAEIERKHRLVPALAPPMLYSPYEKDIPSLTYGKLPTRTGIEMVLGYVMEHCTFTSFESFNAILSWYNVRADRGNPDGRMYQSRGLYYRMIDQEGKKLGAPIKASDFHMGVTFSAIEEKCKLHLSQTRESAREDMRIHIDFNLFHQTSLVKFETGLYQHNRVALIIPAFTRRPTRGATPTDSPGLFYLDRNTMTVFRDTELGPDYTAAAILRSMGLDRSIPEMARQQQLELKPGEKTLLDNPDPNHGPTRDLLFRLSAQHHEWMEQQAEQERQTHRHRLRM